jgi:hypothetical protein
MMNEKEYHELEERMSAEEIGYSLVFLLQYQIPLEKWPKEIKYVIGCYEEGLGPSKIIYK